MATSKGNLFDPILVKDLFTKVAGESALAKLSGQTPIPFVGEKMFTFEMDKEIDIVAENGAKSEGGISIEPVTIVPIKFEYGARVSDEFLYATEEEQIQILKAFNDGFAKKVARGLDLAAMHGINPRTGNASAVVGTNHFDAKVSQTVTYNGLKPDENIEDAIALIEGSDGEVSGTAISPTVRSALSAMRGASGDKLYPEFAFGGKPSTLGAATLAINNTVSNKNVDHAITGDFRNAFKWGYAKTIPTKIIEYGDPDNSGKDLQGHNQVYIRAEVYLGWGILVPEWFARVTVA